ncbi:hypothetical protein LEP48_09075 [Isoptericola sp. NEAU-Y5]|uniref:Recombinase A n=1 Tax=Isoptericola luteus TaxID=2879484 RepID=A0ABS7ZF04_9MICO|nr:hypothetical protein [Isoptericola sp. NEAU-Y5]MCA5893503.1 hypothetical protein [Isoptericola sp. NEAU-Y5]
MTAVVPDLGEAGPADRHARAWAALRAAEQRTGAQPAATLSGPPAPRAASAREAAAAPGSPAPRERRAPRGGHGVDGPGRPVHPDLAVLLPGGMLRGGSVLSVQGSATLLLALLAAASADGAWTAFVGAPTIGMLAAAEAGFDLSRTALVPAPGPDAPLVLAALLDGMDVVVAGPRAALSDADRRRLTARARERATVLVSQSRWPGAHVTLDARGGAWSGVEQGAGWLRRRTLSVLRTGRGAVARPVEIEVEVPVRAEVVVPSQNVGQSNGRDAVRDGAPRLRVA